MLNKFARTLSENVGNQIQDKMTVRFEWHAFACNSGHEFAIKVPTNVKLSQIMEIYNAARCPLCQSATLTKQPNI